MHTRSPKESPARVILLVGRSGAGKSSITEHATKTVGYCNDTKTLSTNDCEVLRTTVDDSQYFFIDTPGFDCDVSAAIAFRRITTLLDTIHGHAVLIGLWYIVDTTRYHTSLDTSAVGLIKYCFETPLFPFTTIIASRWDSGMSLEQLEHRFEQRLDTLREFIDGGASVLKYAEVYGDGTEKPDINRWFEQGRQDSILQQLQIIARQCRNSPHFGLRRRNTGNSAPSTESASSTETQGRLRMFLFQNPLSSLNYGQSGSSAPGPNFVPAILRDDPSNLNDITSFPGIPSERFNFACHLGIVAIRDEVFVDNTISFRDKLATGKIYEHPGLGLEQSIDAIGRRVDSNFLRTITALEFVSYSSMNGEELDALLQQLVSVHGFMHIRPIYQPIFWNCHDVACRFAYLAATPASDLSRLRRLSTIFERSKFPFLRRIQFSSVDIFTMYLMTGMERALFDILRSSKPYISRLASEGKTCADMMALRFPTLRDLNEVADTEWDDFIYYSDTSILRWLTGGELTL
ncbi:hypothetical protein FGSG_04823 [Fusarium graminearum PH-1]|uniref:Chromosome 3, complete genome n=1 Tax=Gibberella zeae (strain ATCC MYA-4620 / CBS 123657 / FGSC 9075 / NRRL 31084 / PH-1) TaxID=229533 RepID=I1RLL7_GIBZE|nr:hypothetical protein FGSG_04823 [Fusarium graminearum PH-1]ESU10698.1 hypothetical protein FGSG_04823 [Fusarium graminearum PH-1]CEF86736.1 unnamed protein product [Fusarium graminearum]|eukprot:XP_011323274.1 hypothetical protein FGSG_04823 [Fusarium graminearum PH-1]